uniref:Teleost multiple tissue opsin 3b n=1 Tax=Salarias fasciatus TaxID=181472 RepID=A0A672HEN6_SALFA
AQSGSVIWADAGALSRAAHTAAAVALGCILVLGFAGNFLALLVFSRFPGLRTPVNLLLINISVSDMLVCVFGTPLSFAASVRGRWLTGTHGCRWYGFSNSRCFTGGCLSLAGMVSLVSLSLLSLERYSTVLGGGHSDGSRHCRARLAVAASWIYSLAWTLPPLLGWSSYGPEGPGTTCSVQWRQRSAAARSYIGCLFVFCLLLPLLLMFFCYGRILLAVRAMARQWREGRVLLMVVAMVTGYLLCWLPYGVVAMLASFGRPGMVPPAASLIPSLLAKASTVLNPVIYVLLNNQVRVFQVFPLHDQVQLRGSAHPGPPDAPQQQGRVAARRRPAHRGPAHGGGGGGLEARSGAGGSVRNTERHMKQSGEQNVSFHL